ncbi:MAG: hypothetical protein KJ661_01235, partial [Candidatus Omnitrophica bacterium]|nr:hypothetical protein [Candidatus Omnitrophota bacterium]
KSVELSRPEQNKGRDPARNRQMAGLLASARRSFSEGGASARTLLKKTFSGKVFFKVVIKVFLKDPFPYVEAKG